MKVRMIVTLEVDPEKWDSNYGTGSEAKKVREDVVSWVENSLNSNHLTDEGTITGVTVKRDV